MAAFFVVALCLGSSAVQLARLVGFNSLLKRVLLVSLLAAAQLLLVVQALSLVGHMTSTAFLWANVGLTALVLGLRHRLSGSVTYQPWRKLIAGALRRLRTDLAASTANVCLFAGYVAFASFAFCLSYVMAPLGDLYHAEMPLYWLQHRTIKPFASHDPHLTSLAFAKAALSLPFYAYLSAPKFSLLFDWVAYMLLPWVVAAIAVAHGFGRAAGFFAGLLCSGFTILALQVFAGKGDLLAGIWVAFAFLLLTSASNKTEASSRIGPVVGVAFFACIMAAGIRSTVLLSFPFLVLLGVVQLGERLWRRDTIAWTLACSAFGLVLSGALWLAVSNLLWFGDPRGFPGFVESHGATVTLQGIWTRTVRGFVYLADFTLVPHVAWPLFTTVQQHILQALNAADAVPGEAGFFVFDNSYVPRGIALGPTGVLVWVPVVLYSLGRFIRNHGSTHVSKQAGIAAIALGIFVSCHVFINWQPRGLFRFAIPAVLLGGPLLAHVYDRPVLRGLVALVTLSNIVMMSLTMLYTQALAEPDARDPLTRTVMKLRPREPERVRLSWSNGRSEVLPASSHSGFKGLYQRVSRALPSYSRIGLIGGRSFELFGDDLTNRVVPLTSGPETPQSFLHVDEPLDYVVATVVNDQTRSFLDRRYPNHELWLRAELADQRQLLLEVYRVGEPSHIQHAAHR